MLPVPFGRRDRLTSAVGPDGSGSNPGSPCTQKPEKSGMDAALSSPLPAGPTVGATAWPKAGVTTAAAVMNTKGNFRHCESIAFLLLSLRSAVSSRIRLHPLRVRLEDGDAIPRWATRRDQGSFGHAAKVVDPPPQGRLKVRLLAQSVSIRHID